MKDLILNIPLLEVLEKMTGYARFLKELVMKKQTANFENVGGVTITVQSIPSLWPRKRVI